MKIELTEEQKLLQETVRRFAEEAVRPRAKEIDESGEFPQRCNLEMVDLEPLRDAEDLDLVRDLLIQHAGYTGSTVAARILGDWDWAAEKFVKVMPVDYRRVLEEQKRAEANRLAQLEEPISR